VSDHNFLTPGDESLADDLLGHCTHTLDETKLGCGYYVQGLIADLTKVAEAGVALAKEAGDDDEGAEAAAPVKAAATAVATAADVEVVEVQVPRLYEFDTDKKKKDDAAAPVYTNLVLGALLPVTAVVSFVVGRVFAMRRERTTQSRQCLSDVE
jgi:hypothetical protein